MESLWRNRPFLRLWLASVVSGFGSRITATALPLTAAITLDATPGQMAMLVIAGQLPDLLFGLLAGSWIDRGRHRSWLVGSNLGQGLLLTIIPLAAIAGALTLPILLVVTFLCGTLAIFSVVASVAVLPTVVRREQLVDANSKLALSGSVVSLAGPGAAGVLIQLVSAPKAILVDAVSFLVSAFSVRSIGSREATPSRQSLWRDVQDGLREMIATPVLRALTISSAVFAIGLSINATILMLYLTRSLGLNPGTIGLYLAAGGIGTLIGSVLAQRVAGAIGTGRSIIGGTAVESIAAFAIPLAIVFPYPLPLLIAGQLVNGIGFSVYSVNHIALRQRIVEPHLLGRITAGRRFVTFALAPLGAVLGAWIGATFGLPVAMVSSGVFFVLGTLVMWRSPVRAIREA
jgi:MFS family permease